MKLYAVFFFFLVLISCNDQPKVKDSDSTQSSDVPVKPVVNAQFSEDSAYEYVKKQVDFGPRVPGTKTYYECYRFLVAKLQSLADTIYLQNSTAITYDRKSIPVQNIIAVFNPNASKRILLSAHWDTRPYADQDDKDRDKPILGANDGASGVGVLLEIASQLKKERIDIGIDIILFDAEDWGDNSGNVENSFCLGSQYWGSNPHVKGYSADFGILLDMVGAPGALFGFESYSVLRASNYVSLVWNTAITLGYGNYFKNFDRGAVIDDHFYVMKATNIPMLDIIDTDPSTESRFGKYWHTHDDNMDAIDKKTLKAVGHTLMHVIRNY